jgi:hypothetical protein
MSHHIAWTYKLAAINENGSNISKLHLLLFCWTIIIGKYTDRHHSRGPYKPIITFHSAKQPKFAHELMMRVTSLFGLSSYQPQMKMIQLFLNFL